MSDDQSWAKPLLYSQTAPTGRREWILDFTEVQICLKCLNSYLERTQLLTEGKSTCWRKRAGWQCGDYSSRYSCNNHISNSDATIAFVSHGPDEVKRNKPVKNVLHAAANKSKQYIAYTGDKWKKRKTV